MNYSENLWAAEQVKALVVRALECAAAEMALLALIARKTQP